MTDEQIIKGLECCNAEKIDCRKCPYRFKDNIDECRMCFGFLSLDALALHQRQKDQIAIYKKLLDKAEERIATARADAVREFADTVIERIIRKKAETSDYWQNDVKRYRAMQGYADIEHEADNFLRGYNEAVDDVLALLDCAEMTEGEK